MPDRTKHATADGRRLRSERSRTAIINAALALMEEGVYVPTAQQISDRAGVGIRSFFRHFEDMETLFAAVDSHLRDSYEAVFHVGDRSGTLDERIERVVKIYGNAYEETKKIFLSTHAQLWRSEVLQKSYAGNQRNLRKNLDDWLPELKAIPRERREAIDAITSFEFWHRLRVHQRQSKKTSVTVIIGLLHSLLKDDLQS